jgi:type II secretory pathway pseudopilin PulG
MPHPPPQREALGWKPVVSIVKSAPTQHLRPDLRARGFALVAALLLMALLSVVAIGLLSLSTVSLRASGHSEARQVARANARVALSLALGQLQTQLGDDRRVTADAAILDPAVPRAHLVGAWDSAATGHTRNPLEKAPDYSAWKERRFRTWLVSDPDAAAARRRDYARQPAPVGAPLLFSRGHDGFDLRAAALAVESDPRGLGGGIAWAVSQEGTKAKANVGGGGGRLAANDEIHAPTRPSLALSGVTRQPGQGWDRRGATLLDARQAALDPELGLQRRDLPDFAAAHGTHALGVLADVVKGGLKADLPLYQPVNGGGPVALTMNYGSVSNYSHVFHTGSAPTFQSLRSHYRLYRHAYLADGQPTALARPQASPYWPDLPSPRGSETSIQPVLDRVLFFISFHADSQGILNVVLTPVVTIWNPYNAAIETEGLVVYPWMDIPVFVNWNINGADRGNYALSQLMGADRTGTVNGRQAEPYFLCHLTASGTNSLAEPIRLGPGEVRIFVPARPSLQLYQRLAPLDARTLNLKPVDSLEDLDLSGGLRVRMTDGMANTLSHVVQPNDRVHARLTFTRANYHYFVTLEDAGRLRGETPRVISEIQVYSGKLANQSIVTRPLSGRQLRVAPQAAALLETFHRTAGQSGQMSDLVFTVNPRQRHVNAMVSGSSGFAAGPHYEAGIRPVADFISEAFQTTSDGRRSFYGYSNAPHSGRDALSFFEIPREPMMSLAAFQHADLADSAFAPASQFGNAWASPFLLRNAAARLLRNATTGERLAPSGLGIYDHSYLLNAALWDGHFFSSAAPETVASEGRGPHGSSTARITRPLADVLERWVRDPTAAPLRNPRHLLHTGGRSEAEILALLKSPAGCRHIAAHLLVDGAFNVNSTHEAAWRAVLASLRGTRLQVERGDAGGSLHTSGEATPAPRLRRPIGAPDDLWNGFRELSDDEIHALAREIVREVRARGPFQSLGEFVNRRLTASTDELGLKGALQAAIDRAGINRDATVSEFDKSGYPYPMNLPEPFTGTGTPGWLTQADLLNSLGPVVTVRSDTFTVRGYGEARDAAGRVLARSWCEAVVQRVPQWTDPADDPILPPADLTPISARFGRRFEVVSYRELSPGEIGS